MTQPNNTECKHCGLLRSTVLATGKNCIKSLMGKALSGEHDFGDHGISFPNNTWEERFEERFPQLFVGTKTDLKSFISTELSALKAEVKSDIGKMKQVPVEIPHGSPYLSGYNKAVEDITNLHSLN